MSIWACPRCHALEHPGPRRCSCGEMTVRAEVATPAPRREDAPEPKTIDLMKVLTDSLTRPEDAAGARDAEWLRQVADDAFVQSVLPVSDVSRLREIAAALSTAEREREPISEEWCIAAGHREAVGELEWQITCLRTALENWGRHFEWCASRTDAAHACDCGLATALARVPSGGET